MVKGAGNGSSARAPKTKDDWNESLEIKPCPFCGCSKVKSTIYKANGSWVEDGYRDGEREWDHTGLYLGNDDYDGRDIVVCGQCHATGPSEKTEVKAVKSWNKATSGCIE